MTWPGLTQDGERLCSTCPVCQLTKRGAEEIQLTTSQDSRI